MKRGASKAKGGAFERLICKKLSLWWTDSERDDVFYRTASSGGRATQRSKRKQKTFGQYGDIQAADPIGQPLMDLCVIECKDGYASDSIADLLDKELRHKPKYEQFIKQARQSHKDAGTRCWMLIARRRGRQIMIFVPVLLFKLIGRTPMNWNVPSACIRVRSPSGCDIVGCLLIDFLDNFFPNDIREALHV